MARGRFGYRIVVEWSDEDEAFLARVPALPGCVAHGDDAEEATREVMVAAGGVLAVLKKEGRPVPKQDAKADYSGKIQLRLPKSLHQRLDRLAVVEGVSLNQLMVALLAQGSGESAKG